MIGKQKKAFPPKNTPSTGKKCVSNCKLHDSKLKTTTMAHITPFSFSAKGFITKSSGKMNAKLNKNSEYPGIFCKVRISMMLVADHLSATRIVKAIPET